MKILFCDWLQWTFPKTNHSLRKHLEKMGVECKYVKPCDIGHCNRALLGKIPKRLSLAEYKGFNLDNLIRTELTMESEWYLEKIPIMIKYRKWARYLIDWAYETFHKEAPNYIVIEGGLTYLSRPILEVAREMGIGVIAIENSFIKNKIFIEFNTGYIVNRHSFARTSQDWLDARVLTPYREKQADKIIKETFRNLKFKSVGHFDISRLKYEKTIFVPLQVYADQVTVYDSPFNNETFILKIFELANTYFKDWNFILKCHPKEERNKPKATGDWLEKIKIPKNVIVLRDTKEITNTQELMLLSDIVMVNTSQAGLEACLLEKPVVVFGDAFYSRKGFTIDYNEDFNWKKLKNNYRTMTNIKQCKLWFLYFYNWLFNKQLTNEDKLRINRALNLNDNRPLPKDQ